MKCPIQIYNVVDCIILRTFLTLNSPILSACEPQKGPPYNIVFINHGIYTLTRDPRSIQTLMTRFSPVVEFIKKNHIIDSSTP
jgi:hypothetical protein